ncbi:MAG: GNAT family N-acetyltransferase [Bacteroidia bacterium]|nr:GNAT family N-acetyltransferase [Bacteroidia bacterium]
MKVTEALSPEDLNAILQLRYEVLRKPWAKSIESATDDLEAKSVNAFIKNENGKIIACARLHENENRVGQIRFMAVDVAHQGKGLGKEVCGYLEKKARELGYLKIQLQARENAVEFYKRCGYAVKEKSYLMWEVIQHYLMEKEL